MKIRIKQDESTFMIKLETGEKYIFWWEDYDVELLVELFNNLGHTATCEDIY